MKVAVITPYFDEPTEVLRRAHQSVLAQTHPCTHFLAADGQANPDVEAWDIRHLILPGPHKDYGNTARGLGSLCALNLGFDGFAFLDADNWYGPEHVESLVRLCQDTGSRVGFSDRHVVLVSGEVVPVEDLGLLGREQVDTNCFFITSSAAFLLSYWVLLDPSMAAGGDQFVYSMIRSLKVSHGFTGKKTLYYETRWPRHYEAMGKTPPDDARKVDWGAVQASQPPGWMQRRLGLKVQQSQDRKAPK